MNTTLVKCRCRNCNGHLEFEASRDGEVLACPHCNLETQLYIPGHASMPIAHGKLQPVPKRQIWLALVIGIIGVVVVAGLLYLFATSELARGLLGGTLGVVVAGIALVLAVLWIIFPVFVYFGIGRLQRLLEQIERNTRS